jgi:hypothetical protein
MKRSIIANTFAIAALALGLAPLATAKDKTEDKTCSNETIRGAFARTDTGFVMAPNAAPMPLAGVGLHTFDGNGTWTSTGYGSLNGTQMQLVSKGTYTVNPDCTGHYEPDVAPPGRTGQAFFVIVDAGNEIQIFPTDPGAAIICVARRVFPACDAKD